MKVFSFLCIAFLLLASSGCSDLLGNVELQDELIEKSKEEGVTIQLDGPTIINEEKCPIFIVDGKVWGVENAIDESKINPDDIERIRILEAKKAIKKFGSAGKYGAILITTEKKAKH